MDVIDGDWIRARLSGKRGEKAKLARAMRVESHVVAKILAGKRQVKPKEMPAVVAFFGSERADPDHAEAGDLVPVYNVTEQQAAEEDEGDSL